MQTILYVDQSLSIIFYQSRTGCVETKSNSSIIDELICATPDYSSYTQNILRSRVLIHLTLTGKVNIALLVSTGLECSILLVNNSLKQNN